MNQNMSETSIWRYMQEHEPQLLEQKLATGNLGEAYIPHATTIVALTYADGVLLAGDRRATMGNVIASRRIEKVFPADEYSAIGIAGTAGLAIELVKLFQLELEHYEKIEGHRLSLEGKANRLGAMLRQNLGMALQGLAALPLFVGYDTDRDRGRIFSYDVTGGRYEEEGFHTIGSGSVFAKGSMKKRWREGLDEEAAISVGLEALVDASDDDSATSGPDARRNIWPVIAVINDSGYHRVEDQVLENLTVQIMEQRAQGGGVA